MAAIIYSFCAFSKSPLSSEDLPGAFYPTETGSGKKKTKKKRGSLARTQAELYGWSHFTKATLPFYWEGFNKTASFWQFNWKFHSGSALRLTAVTLSKPLLGKGEAGRGGRFLESFRWLAGEKHMIKRNKKRQVCSQWWEVCPSCTCLQLRATVSYVRPAFPIATEVARCVFLREAACSPGGNQRLSDFALSPRLSPFLWWYFRPRPVFNSCRRFCPCARVPSSPACDIQGGLWKRTTVYATISILKTNLRHEALA